MTNVEMSNEFDTLYQNITSNQAPGVDEYEKSVFLTKAQKIIVRRQFDPNSDKLREGFDGSQQRQYDFSTLIITEDLKNITPSVNNNEKFDKRSSVFVWPSSCFLSVNEVIVDNAGNQYSVSPISYDEYYRQMTKPYQYPPKRIAWRMMTNNKKRIFAGSNFANTGYVLPLSEDFLSWINTELGTTTITNCLLDINWVQGSSSSDNSISINGTPIQVDAKTARISIIIVATTDSNLYNYNLGDIIKLFAEEESVPAYINWNLLDNIFVGSNEQGTLENYPVSYTDSNILWRAFKGNELFLEFPIILDDIANYGVYDEDLGLTIGEFKLGERTSGTLVEILGRFQNSAGKLSPSYIDKYKLRYVKTLSPIVLVDLKDLGLSIDGVDEVTKCQLPVECHHEILELAVSLAKIAMIGSTETLASQAQNKE